MNVRIELPLPFGMSFLSGCELIEPLLCAFFAVKKKKQEKKKVAAEKSKEVKEAEEWKSGCTFFFSFSAFAFSKDSRPCVDVEMKLAKGTSKADAAAAKAAEAGKFLDPFCSLYTQQNN